ncbi:FtsX-like permease family protein [Candidatus Harpocratesius sp.]
MTFFSSIQYTFQQFWRNPKRSSSIMLGIIVSITLISGIFVASSGLMKYGISNGLNDIQFDFILDISTEHSISEIEGGFNSVKSESDDLGVLNQLIPTVTRVFLKEPPTNSFLPESIRNQRGIAIEVNETYSPDSTVNNSIDQFTIMGINPENLANNEFKNMFSFQNSFSYELGPNEVLIDSEMALLYNLSMGDSFNAFSFWQDSSIYNYTGLKVAGIFEIQDFNQMLTAFFPDDYQLTLTSKNKNSGLINTILSQYLQRSFINRHYIIADLLDSKEIISKLSSPTPQNFSETIKTRYLITLNHENLPVLDEEALNTYISMLKNQLILTLADPEIIITDNVSAMIDEIQSDLALFEVLSLVVSLPTVMLGVFLTDTIYKLSLTQRRRELGLLKTRGSTSRENIIMLLQEATQMSLIAGIIGSFLGLGTSYGIVKIILGAQFSEFLEMQTLQISFPLVIGVTFAGIAVTLISLSKSFREMSQLTVTEYTSHYSEIIAQKTEKRKFDWIAILIGLIPIILIELDLSSSVSSGILSVLYKALNTLATALMWISPFLLTYGLVKLLIGRSVPRLYIISRFLGRLLIGEKGELVATNIIRNPRRTTRLVFILSITVCFGISSAIITASQVQYEYDQAYIRTGADLRIQTNLDEWKDFQNTLYNFSDDFAAITPVGAVSAQLFGSGQQVVYPKLLNATEYKSIAKLDDRYSPDGDVDEDFIQLSENLDGVLISQIWAEKMGFKIGNIISLVFSTIEGLYISIPFKIVGYLEILPGIAQLNSIRSISVVVNRDYVDSYMLGNYTGLSFNYLISLVENPYLTQNATIIGHNLANTFLNEIKSVTILEEVLLSIQENHGAMISALDLMAFQFPFLLFISGMGIFVVTFMTVLEKRREMALMRVRGVLRSDLFKLQFMEGLVIFLLGIIVGSLGFLIGFIMNRQFDSLDPFSQLTGIQREYIIPAGQIAIEFGLILVLFAIATIWTTYQETKHSEIGKITEILRNA